MKKKTRKKKNQTTQGKRSIKLPFSSSVTRLLEAAKVKYGILEHKTVYTAHDAAQTTKKKLSEIAKTVLVKAGSNLAVVVIPAGKYVDLAAVGKALKSGPAAMAKERDIVSKLKTKIGLLHPFGQAYGLPTLLDAGISRTKKIIASAESYRHSVEISVKDFEKLTSPLKGKFGKNKR